MVRTIAASMANMRSSDILFELWDSSRLAMGIWNFLRMLKNSSLKPKRSVVLMLFELSPDSVVCLITLCFPQLRLCMMRFTTSSESLNSVQIFVKGIKPGFVEKSMRAQA